MSTTKKMPNVISASDQPGSIAAAISVAHSAAIQKPT